ncbi:VWA domain-containing protein [Nonomuraea sp. FMUSA5-5]|uniref:VWA domain-containing protein n=1 Tax=Nonomuraea composti TaxID=2720023 RepID=A0ABX1BB36_9ACTN|nr:VWA domain-containing protein [Nonomuraea sp. FMUSA5-5]NJP92511.1 VWA domain-containing protein [Nonomuraea sp. FMUSA5-5]
MRLNRPASRWAGIVAATSLLLATGPCAPRALGQITILAAPELMDLRPVLSGFARSEGIRIELREAGGAPLSTQLGTRPPVDAVWLPAGFEQSGDGHRQLGAGRTITFSPVLLALKAPVADRLGWTGERVTWKQIASAARGHRFTFGMSAPDSAFAGRAAVLAAASGFTEVIDSVDDGDIYPAAGGLRAMSTAQTITAPTDAELITRFLQSGGAAADGLFTYESQIARLNASGRLGQQLVPIRPSDGVVNATYTLRPLLKPRSPKAAEHLSRLTSHLLSAGAQREIADRIRHRPITPGVRPPAGLPADPPRLLGIPRDQTVVDRLVAVYLGRYRYATRTVFLLDVSGSMRGARTADLRRAAEALAGAPAVHPSGGAADEQAIFLPFASSPAKPVIIDLPGARDAVSDFLARLTPGGYTATYDALVAGLRNLARIGTGDRILSIVLITDGMANRGRTLSEFMKYHDTLPPDLKRVPVYPVLVKGADARSMRELADRTGGRLLDARHSGLATAFTTFRAQQ